MPPFIKFVIVVTFVLIVISLGFALFRLAKNNGDENDTSTVKALSVRVGLSIALFALIMILSALGIITPNA